MESNGYARCINNYDPRFNDGCEKGAACATCGWNIDVYNKRMKQINEEGLSLCRDGLRRLLIHK